MSKTKSNENDKENVKSIPMVLTVRSCSWKKMEPSLVGKKITMTYRMPMTTTMTTEAESGNTVTEITMPMMSFMPSMTGMTGMPGMPTMQTMPMAPWFHMMTMVPVMVFPGVMCFTMLPCFMGQMYQWPQDIPGEIILECVDEKGNVVRIKMVKDSSVT
jgi:hypothetical protein